LWWEGWELVATKTHNPEPTPKKRMTDPPESRDSGRGNVYRQAERIAEWGEKT